MKRKILAAVLCMGALLATPVKPLANIDGLFSVAYAQETAQSFKSVSELQSALNALPEGGKLLVEDTSLYFSGSESVTVPSGVTLVLENDVVLDGKDREKNTWKPLVTVSDKSKLIMNSGSKIQNNDYILVEVQPDGYFELNGGLVQGLQPNRYAGIYVNGGNFIMNDGVISDFNMTTGEAVVYIIDGYFKMSGGKITNNFVKVGYGITIEGYSTFEMINGEVSENYSDDGGGVRISDSDFIMYNGSIVNNQTRVGWGAGVCMCPKDKRQMGNATFTMYNGLIANNQSDTGGGGIYIDNMRFSEFTPVVDSLYVFNMKGGKIANNKSSTGGGVYISGGMEDSDYQTTQFIMSGGTICDNQAYVGSDLYMQQMNAKPILTFEQGEIDISGEIFVCGRSDNFIKVNGLFESATPLKIYTYENLNSLIIIPDIETGINSDSILSKFEYIGPDNYKFGVSTDGLILVPHTINNDSQEQPSTDIPSQEEIAKEEVYLPSTPISDGLHEYSLGTMLYQDGKRVKGLYEYEGATYFFNEQGFMQTGWVEFDEGWRYFAEDGKMVTGWLQLGNVWYYLDPETGLMFDDGLAAIGKSTYYFYDWGGMASDWWYEASDGWYFFGGSGVMKTAQWLEWKGDWYYLTESGKMATDTTIGGYTVNAGGVWVS